jgi:hypothetical protein
MAIIGITDRNHNSRQNGESCQQISLTERLALVPINQLDQQAYIWSDYQGRKWQLAKMETSHLINILRLIVNEWAKRHGIDPVPIRNPLAVLNLQNYKLEQYAGHTRVFCEEVLRRLKTERLSTGYQVVWNRVIAKIFECLDAMSSETPTLTKGQYALTEAEQWALDDGDEDDCGFGRYDFH